MLQMFYQSVVASVLFYEAVCMGSRLKAVYANEIAKIIKCAICILGLSGGGVGEEDTVQLLSIMDSDGCSLYVFLGGHRSNFS